MLDSQRFRKVLLTFLSIYALLVLPSSQAILALVFGVLIASILREEENLGKMMFGVFARIITNARSKAKRPIPLRDQALNVCCAIENYQQYVSRVIDRKKQLFFMLDKSQQDACSKTFQRISEIQKLKDKNYNFLSKITDFAAEQFNISRSDIRAWASRKGSSKNSAYEAVELLEHFVRDYSSGAEGRAARFELFSPFFPWLKGKRRILVPGSGLGRFAVELVRQAQSTEIIVDAPELSPMMWLGSKFAVSRKEVFNSQVYPFLLQFSYWKRSRDQLEPVPLQLEPLKMQSPNFVCENFLNFDNGYRYDAVATLFFIDTAQNVLSYIDRIWTMLEPDGIWCNYGPLKWGSAAYVEFSIDEMLDYIRSHGWTVLEIWDKGSNRYNGSEKSLLNTRYDLYGWVAQKKA